MSIYTRRARQIVEEAISGPDPFNISKAAAAEFPVIILSEAWSPEKRKEVLAHAQESGYDMVDHLITGDYDLVLWHTDKIQNNPNAYVVSINNAEHDPLSAEAQQTKQLDTVQALPRDVIKEKVAEWVSKYGSVIIGSVMTERNFRYLKMFKRMFPGYTFLPYHKNDLKFGFRLSKPVSQAGRNNLADPT